MTVTKCIDCSVWGVIKYLLGCSSTRSGSKTVPTKVWFEKQLGKLSSKDAGKCMGELFIRTAVPLFSVPPGVGEGGGAPI